MSAIIIEARREFARGMDREKPTFRPDTIDVVRAMDRLLAINTMIQSAHSDAERMVSQGKLRPAQAAETSALLRWCDNR